MGIEDLPDGAQLAASIDHSMRLGTFSSESWADLEDARLIADMRQQYEDQLLQGFALKIAAQASDIGFEKLQTTKFLKENIALFKKHVSYYKTFKPRLTRTPFAARAVEQTTCVTLLESYENLKNRLKGQTLRTKSGWQVDCDRVMDYVGRVIGPVVLFEKLGIQTGPTLISPPKRTV